MGLMPFNRCGIAVVLAVVLSWPAVTRAEPLDFNHDVRPILSDNCFKCHGFDDAARKSKLRLDLRETALKGGKSGDPAIIPGKPEESELVKRIFSKDPDEVMPPKTGKGPLTEGQKNVLKRWVAEGAVYKTHWAFLAPKSAPLPAVKRAEWPRNEIDRFVLAKMEVQGLGPSNEADRYTLVRRLYLDLIGLPPTPEEADAFVADTSPAAYENLVERLLASPQYSERWARRWLDLARYADTNGFEKDRPRSVWPYRDWVIKAFNSDMPFDQFTVEQLAGDMLPNATIDQKIATGFHRNTMRNEEGGIDPMEYRFYSVVDRTAVTGTTWLGLTVMCAQCHTHKFDPITHKDYYSLMAFLDNCDEPEADLPSPDIASKRAEIERKIATLQADLPNQWPAPGDMTWRTPEATVTAASAKPQKQADGSWKFAGPAPDKDTYTFTFDTEAGTAVDAIRVEALMSGAKGPGRTAHGNFVLSGIAVSVMPNGSTSGTETVKIARAEADFSQAEFPVENALKNLPHGGWGIAPQEKKNHTATFYPEKPLVLPKGGKWTIVLQQQFGSKHTMGQVRVSLGSKSPKPESKVKPSDEVARHFAEWEKRESAKAVQWTVLRPKTFTSNSPTLTLLDDNSVLASGDITKSDVYDLTYRTDLTGITAVRIEALPHESLPKHGPGMISYEGPFGDFSLSNIALAMNGQAGKFSSAVHSFAAGNNGASNAIDDNLQTGWMINGGQGKPHQAVFVLATPTTQAGELNLKLFFERYFACALGHFRISVTTDPRAAQTSALPPAVEAALLMPAGERSESQRALLMERFLATAPELAAARQKIEALEKSLPNPPSTLVMTERPAGHARVTRIHHRGEFLSPKEAVEPNVLGILPPLPKDAPRNRLSFARWLVSRENPLTARVAVNRQWQAFFGRGIVKTVQDFGYQGDPPTHPELLDWLAVAFMDRGWSFKQLDRLIVSSATYRQSSQVSTELAAKDPENLLLARGPRFRVDAEMVRDAALREAGLLSSKMYGPSVFPAQLASITTEGTYGPLEWKVSPGEDRYRRSLYTFSKRTAPFALYSTFDAPTGEACIARREVSDTPLQALTLLNDQVFMEVAQALGRTMADAKGESDEARAVKLFRRCIIRPPAPDELSALVDFVHQQRQRFAAKELDPAKIAGASNGDGGDVIERATWTAAARAILNLDEAVTKD